MTTLYSDWKIERVEKEALLLYQSPYDPGRRVYLLDDVVYKVVNCKESMSLNQRINTLEKECGILRRLEGIRGIPKNPLFCRSDNYEWLTYRYIDGEPLDKATNNKNLSIVKNAKLLWVLLKISLRGVAHRDVKLQNLFIDDDKTLWIIDFDQAIVTTVLQSVWLNIYGTKNSTPSVHGSFKTIRQSYILRKTNFTNNYFDKVKKHTKEMIKTFTPDSVIERYRGYNRQKTRFKSNEQFQQNTMPPNLAKTASTKLVYLRRAWLIARESKASSPSVPIAYYSLDEEGYHFPGERAWLDRWKYLSVATNYGSKRVIELGCNMGLLSCWILKEKDADEVLAVDMDAEILAAAQLVAGAYGVSPYFKKINFDSSEKWDSELRKFGADMVFAMNVLNWVRDKERLLRFLFTFNEIIFEGHENTEKECKIFEDNGFCLEKIAISERNRTVIRAVRYT